MRLTRFLNERDEKVISAIQPFLREFGESYKKNQFIWRGSMGLRTKTYTYKKTRKDRKPRFVDEELHEFLGKLSKELWGWNIRTEGVFTADKSTASKFGDGRRYIFIPDGKYSYVWTNGRTKNAVYGLYDDFSLIKQDLKDEPDFLETEEGRHEYEISGIPFPWEIKKELESLYRYNYYTSLLSKYLSTGNEFEAIFNCKNYFMIEQNYWEESFKDKIWG